MKKLNQMKLNDFDELNEKDMKKIVGGGTVIGVRFNNGTCYCDYQYSRSNNVIVCEQVCELTWCEEAGITTGIGNLR